MPLGINIVGRLKDVQGSMRARAQFLVQVRAEVFYEDWYDRFGKNERVGGPPLRPKTIEMKGHDRKLELTFAMRDATTLQEQTFRQSATTFHVQQDVVNYDEKFPWHEYGRWTAIPPVVPRPTFRLSVDTYGKSFARDARDDMNRIFGSKF